MSADVNDKLRRLFGNEIHGHGGVFQDLGTGALGLLERAELCGEEDDVLGMGWGSEDKQGSRGREWCQPGAHGFLPLGRLPSGCTRGQ
jgi:hypothetical protein